jgi:hypothetical protein
LKVLIRSSIGVPPMWSCFGSLSQKYVVSTRFTHQNNQPKQKLRQC